MELDLNIDSNGNVIVNTLSEYVAYISQLQAANEGTQVSDLDFEVEFIV